MVSSPYSSLEFAGCWCWEERDGAARGLFGRRPKRYLPQVDLKVHSTILASTSRTTLTQTFINPSFEDNKDVQYTFPLYDGVSVAGFKCWIGDSLIEGIVKEREEAKAEYKEAVKQGKATALLEQSIYASDTFSTSIGKIPASSKAVVEITYLGELQHDSQADGVRFTIPTQIAPRYSNTYVIPNQIHHNLAETVNEGKIDITIDVAGDKGSIIRGLQSSSHPIAITLGRTSVAAADVFEAHQASATLTTRKGNVAFDNDFVLIVQVKEQEVPAALLETHATIAGQRAVMATLVPKFNIPNNKPEIVFIIDRSGSMQDKVKTLRSALKVFLKSLPVGVTFNLCSFGSRFSFLWKKSQKYDSSSLREALNHVDRISADMGGTEMYQPVQATVNQRLNDSDLEVLLLTDGQIWDQARLFDLINKSVSKNPIRFFSLGLGDSASHSLIQGIARAGNGFAQSVGSNEQLDRKVIRMLKGALTPHVTDYSIELEYEHDREDDYEMVDDANECQTLTETLPASTGQKEAMEVDTQTENPASKTPISLLDPAYKELELTTADENIKPVDLPTFSVPKVLQAPYKIPQLYPHARTAVYMILSPEATKKSPKYVVLKGTSKHGPLSLKIPVQDIGQGTTVHQLAARKLTQDLEEGRGWVFDAKGKDGDKICEGRDSIKKAVVKREAVRLGLQFQVGGKHTSFIAVEKTSTDGQEVKGLENEVVSRTFSAEDNQAIAPSFGTARFCSIDSGAPYVTPQHRSSVFEGPPAPGTHGGGNSLPKARGNPFSAGLFRSPAPQGTNSSVFSAPSARQPHISASFFGASATQSGSANLFDASNTQSLDFDSDFCALSVDPVDHDEWMDSFVATMGDVVENEDESIEPEEEDIEEEGGANVKETHSTPHNNTLYDLISLQSFEGEWDWSDKVFKLMGLKAADVQTKLNWASILGFQEGDVKEKDAAQRTLIATLLVVAFFKKKFQNDAETWELVGEKAMGLVSQRVQAMGGSIVGREEEVMRLFDGLV
ncbi:hypothetical protein AJ80_08913 [Polytolypa hystricis UAMH7299]|uniref:VIT domain-containing protein n=1 Tax=Polytolypa hystricis (strain UAMH7299) TaxID=1447883 RepID=A0A2B7X036_POLH7|nr:hypothetical protein AJ80_08913 [Polytolypa hystricis UAMH7299]